MSEVDSGGPTLAAGTVDSGGPTLPAAGVAAATPLPEIELDRCYDVGAEIARGGMGRIRRAEDRRLGRVVALKELVSREADLRDRFEREARLTARLQHPAIVPIYEAGRLPGGEPFYAMKLVSGRPLDVVLGEARTLDARLALLPNLTAVVEAIAYAHGERIIHRDLKPANVLVGRFGETVVIDWGLAKKLDSADPQPISREPANRAAAAAPDMTQAGSVMGTPAYMPPEQARGEAVGPAADVYALGAMLYQLLAGVSPYRGRTADEVLDAVIAGPPPALASREPAAPRDLTTLAERAMARDPADLPTAQALADDLKRFQTGKLVSAHAYSFGELMRRFVARNRVAVATVAIALVVLAGFGTFAISRVIRERDVARRERSRADAERARAEQQRASAEALLESLVPTLRDRLQPLGRVDLLAGVAGPISAYYDADSTRTAAAGDDAISRRALTLDILAEAEMRLGDLDGALNVIDTALALRRPQHAAGVPEASRRLVETLNQKGEILWRRSELGEARKVYEESIAIASAITPADGARRGLATATSGLGDVLRASGDPEAALARYRESRAHAVAFAKLDPAGGARTIALANRRIGQIELDLGHAAEGTAAVNESLTIARTNLAGAPEDPAWRATLVVSLNEVGAMELRTGKFADALAHYSEAAAVGAALVARDAVNADWQNNLAISKQGIGSAQERLGQLELALAAHVEAETIIERLRAENPEHPFWTSNLAAAHQQVGRVHAARGDVASAENAYLSAIALREAMVAAKPDQAEWKRGLAGTHMLLGTLLIEARRPADALVRFERALALREELSRGSESASAKWERSLSLEAAGIARRETGDAAGGDAALQASAALRRDLVAKNPADARARTGLERVEKMLAPGP